MNKTSLAVAVAAIILAGCISSSEPPAKTQYTLTGGTSGQPRAPAGAANPPAQGKILRLAQVDVPAWLNTTAIYYRLNYRNNTQIAAYSRSAWVSSPATMLTNLIRDKLADAPTYKAVIGPGESSRAGSILRVQLTDFQQDFKTPKQSHCQLSAKATLIDNSSRNIAGQKGFTYQPPAPSPNAAGGVKCLHRASLHLARDLRTWLQTLNESSTPPKHR